MEFITTVCAVLTDLTTDMTYELSQIRMSKD